MTEQRTTEAKKSAGNDLAVYMPHTLDIVGHIKRLEKPISSINPESRIVSNGSMYAGGFCDLTFNPERIGGRAYVRFLKALESIPKNSSLTTRLNFALFGENPKVDDNLVVEHDGRKYQQQWVVRTSQYETIVSLYRYQENKHVTGDFPLKLKALVAEEVKELWTNELLLSLFAPLMNPLIQTHQQMMQF